MLSNSTNTSEKIICSRLNKTLYPVNDSCPLNEFCSAAALDNCLNRPLSSCSECNQQGVVGYAISVSLLGLMILVGNVLVVAVYCKHLRRKNSSKVDAIKVSLGIADIMSGLLIFFSLLPNLNSTMKSTAGDVLRTRCAEDNVARGFFFILSLSSSFYHLIYFGVLRYFATKWPFFYKNRSIKGVSIQLGFVWLLAAFTAGVPGFFPNVYRYCTRSYISFVCSSSLIAYTVLFAILFLIPFMVMGLFSLLVTLLVRKQLKRANKLRANVRERYNTHPLKKSNTAFKTVGLMQLGFMISLGPSFVCLVFEGLNLFGSENAIKIELACFTLCFLNSLVNVFVYSVRDEKFRETICETWKKFQQMCCNFKLCKSKTLPKIVVLATLPINNEANETRTSSLPVALSLTNLSKISEQ